MDARQLAQAIRSTLGYAHGDRYAEVRAVLGILAEHLDVIANQSPVTPEAPRTDR